jgi:hypothetical protein
MCWHQISYTSKWKKTVESFFFCHTDADFGIIVASICPCAIIEVFGLADSHYILKLIKPGKN